MPGRSLRCARHPLQFKEVFRTRFRVPVGENEKLARVVERLNSSVMVTALWRNTNRMAVDRLLMNDHGPVHVKIVANIALRILRLFVEGGVTPSIVQHHGMGNEDAEVVVVLASALHDVGHVVHRENHEEFSVVLASQVIPAVLKGIYDEDEATTVMGETLHAIYAHRTDVHPITIEAAIVRVADALDMESGRARIPFEAGSHSIHAVSAYAVENVEIHRGDERPVRIDITMKDSAGMFQVDYLLKKKLAGTGIEDFFEVYVHSRGVLEGDVRVW